MIHEQEIVRMWGKAAPNALWGEILPFARLVEAEARAEVLRELVERADRDVKLGEAVRCIVCDKIKLPAGRDPERGAGGFCDEACIGYGLDPQRGSLWACEGEDAEGAARWLRGVQEEVGR